MAINRQEAKAIVEEAISNALNHISTIKEEKHGDTKVTKYEDIQCPLSRNFTAEIGIQYLEKFMKIWPLKDSWKFCINFLESESEKYRYEVIWSIPTRRKPIPRVTASVYVTILCLSDVSFYLDLTKLCEQTKISKYLHFSLSGRAGFGILHI